MVILAREDFSIQKLDCCFVEMFNLKTHLTTAGEYQISQNRGFGGSRSLSIRDSSRLRSRACFQLRNHPFLS